MGYLKIHCGDCGGEWDVYHRDINNPHVRQCPHCYAEIDPYTWKQIVTGFGEMRDAELELVKDHENHVPLFAVDFMHNEMHRGWMPDDMLKEGESENA